MSEQKESAKIPAENKIRTRQGQIEKKFTGEEYLAVDALEKAFVLGLPPFVDFVFPLEFDQFKVGAIGIAELLFECEISIFTASLFVDELVDNFG
jgi:hypothetical protein